MSEKRREQDEVGNRGRERSWGMEWTDLGKTSNVDARQAWAAA